LFVPHGVDPEDPSFETREDYFDSRAGVKRHLLSIRRGFADGWHESEPRAEGAAPPAAEFWGGGTRFECLGSAGSRPVCRPPRGSAAASHGHNRHCGQPVTRGVRYILAGFLTAFG
jgi:hypothetical protein